MFAVIDWNAVGAVVGILSFMLAVGAIGGRWWVKHRPGAGMKMELDGLKDQLTEVRTLVGTVSETLTGRSPTAYDPAPPLGLVGIVIHHGEVLAQQNKELAQQSRILSKMVPNGGDSDSPGDILLRLDREREARDRAQDPKA